jgi:hypothetical protein
MQQRQQVAGTRQQARSRIQGSRKEEEEEQQQQQPPPLHLLRMPVVTMTRC